MDAIYRVDGNYVVTSPHAAGPWNETMQHGSAPSALVTWLAEQMPTASPMHVTRVTIDLLRPVPVAPLTFETEVLREGRKIQLVGVRLMANGTVVVRATVLKIRAEAQALPPEIADPPVTVPPPDQGGLLEPRYASSCSTGLMVDILDRDDGRQFLAWRRVRRGVRIVTWRPKAPEGVQSIDQADVAVAEAHNVVAGFQFGDADEFADQRQADVDWLLVPDDLAAAAEPTHVVVGIVPGILKAVRHLAWPFVTGMTIRAVRGGFLSLGPGAIWYRANRPIIEGAGLSQVMRAVIAADFSNGSSPG
jgi:hypothetical protein